MTEVLIAIFCSCHSLAERQLLRRSGVACNFGCHQFPSTATRGQDSGKFKLLPLLILTIALTFRVPADRAKYDCLTTDKSLTRTATPRSPAHWLPLKAMAYRSTETQRCRHTAQSSALVAGSGGASTTPATSLSASTDKRMGAGSLMEPNRRSSTTTNRILADWRIPLGSPRSTRRAFVERSDSKSSYRVHRRSVQPRGRFPSTSTRTNRLRARPRRVLRQLCRASGTPPGGQ